MKKTIGITCDDNKKNKYREKLKKNNFIIVLDEPLMYENSKVHFFKLEVNADEFEKEIMRVKNILQEIEIEIKQSN